MTNGQELVVVGVDGSAESVAARGPDSDNH